jgi:hypothetical protein
MEVSGELNGPAALVPGKEPLCSLYRTLGVPQSCCGRFLGERRFELRTVEPVV